MTDGLNSELLVRYSGQITRHLNSEQVKVCYSDISVIQIFVIHNDTVYGTPTSIYLPPICEMIYVEVLFIKG